MPLQGPRYEVALLLEAPEERIGDLKAAWNRLGSSVVVVGGKGLWRCHVHTDDVDVVLKAARARGRQREVRVTDLAAQSNQQRHASALLAGTPGPIRTAVLAVAAGAGIGDLLRSLGASRVLVDRPLVRPSTGELLDAIEAVPAGEVIILPNNRRIIPAAEQAAGLTDKTVRVVPTRAIPAGLVALFAYDPSASVQDNANAMTAAAARVRCGEVTRAVRHATWQAGGIRAGDWLGIAVGSGIRVVHPDLPETAVGLLQAMVREEDVIVTVVDGEGSTPEATGRILAWLGEHHPRVAVEVLHGGQPLFPYVVGVEPAEPLPGRDDPAS